MGLVTTLDSAVGVGVDDTDGWERLYVSKRMFWQIPPTAVLVHPAADGQEQYLVPPDRPWLVAPVLQELSRAQSAQALANYPHSQHAPAASAPYHV